MRRRYVHNVHASLAKKAAGGHQHARIHLVDVDAMIERGVTHEQAVRRVARGHVGWTASGKMVYAPPKAFTYKRQKQEEAAYRAEVADYSAEDHADAYAVLQQAALKPSGIKDANRFIRAAHIHDQMLYELTGDRVAWRENRALRARGL